MTSTNVELLHTLLDQVFERRRIDEELLAPDAEWVNPHDAVETGTRHGAGAFNRAIASVFATWDDVHFECDRIIENGDEVVALGELRGRLQASGMEVPSPHGQVWRFRDGRVARMSWFNSREQALEAAGLTG